jgi:putative amino-acid transport system permease protein
MASARGHHHRCYQLGDRGCHEQRHAAEGQGFLDRSQWDAARSIGMTMRQMLRRIILPQAARVAAPTLVNYFIDIIKSTSLAFTLGVTELMGAAQKEAASSFLYFEAFILVAIIYWIIVEGLSYLQQGIERHLNRAYS